MSVRIDLSGVLGKIDAMKKMAIRAATSQAFDDISMYVPLAEGALMGSAEAGFEPETGHIEWNTPYAHYLYEGVVYGPNIPIYKGGVLMGFYSPPRKRPMGRPLRISKAHHARATKKWTEAAKRDNLEHWRRAAEKAMGGHT